MSNILRFEHHGHHPSELSVACNTAINQFIERNPDEAESAGIIRDNILAQIPTFSQEGYSVEDIGEVVDDALSDILSGAVATREDMIQHPETASDKSSNPALAKVISLADYRAD